MSTSTGSGSETASARTAPSRPRADRAVQAALGQYRRQDAADQAAQLGQRLAARHPGLDQQLDGLVGLVPHQLLGQADVHAEGSQPGLRAVMQIAFDTAQLGCRGVPHLGAGLGQLASGGGEQDSAELRVGLEDPGRAVGAGGQCGQAGRQASGDELHAVLVEGVRRGGLPNEFDALDEQRHGDEAKDQAHRDVGQVPQQVAPGRRVGQQPAAAPQLTDQARFLVGRLGTVRGGYLDPGPLPRPAALALGQAAHPEQDRRGQEHAEAEQEEGDGQHRCDKQRDAGELGKHGLRETASGLAPGSPPPVESHGRTVCPGSWWEKVHHVSGYWRP
jgi:hypothetical protein